MEFKGVKFYGVSLHSEIFMGPGKEESQCHKKRKLKIAFEIIPIFS